MVASPQTALVLHFIHRWNVGELNDLGDSPGTRKLKREIPEGQRTKKPILQNEILKTYTPDQAGQAIRQEDVIRAANGHYYEEAEVHQWKDKSMMHCPTYGNCEHCMSGGPLGEYCNFCSFDTGHYAICKINRTQHILDSEYVAEHLGQGFEQYVAANRAVAWISTPMFKIDEIRIKLAIKRRYADIKDVTAREGKSKATLIHAYNTMM
jgi:hypothetical protein